MADEDSALVMFNVEHASVKVVLEDAHQKVELHLSPVMLAYWSDFFATRYKPGANWSSDSVIVDSVDVAKEMLRAFYGAQDDDRWKSYGPKWVISILKLCDEWQVNGGMTNAILKLLEAILPDRDSVLQHLQGVSDLQESSLGVTTKFSSMLTTLFRRIRVPAVSDLQAMIDVIPDGVRLEYLSFLLRSTSARIRKIALEAVILDLSKMEEGPRAKSYLRQILSMHTIDVNDADRKTVMDKLALIEGDTLDGALIPAARDAIAIRLHGGYPEVRKRRRAEEEEDKK